MDEQAVPAAPAGSVPATQFYDQDPRRAAGRTLSYGSRWAQPGWTDQPDHVVELYWLGATHELVAFYVAYDWTEVDPRELMLTTDEVLGEDYGAGLELGHLQRVLDEASTATYVEVLARLGSDLECHQVMVGWPWLQHHPDGLGHLRRRLAERTHPAQDRA